MGHTRSRRTHSPPATRAAREDCPVSTSSTTGSTVVELVETLTGVPASTSSTTGSTVVELVETLTAVPGGGGPGRVHLDSWSVRRPPDRAVRQDPPARGRPRAGSGLSQGDRTLRRARAQPRAHPHLPAHAAGPVERPRGRPRRRAGRQRAAGVQPLRRAARAARRRRRDDGPLRPAAAGEAPPARPGAGQHRPPGARGGAPRQADRRGCSVRGSTPTPWPCTPPSAAASSRPCSSSAGRPRTAPATSTARPTPSTSARTAGRCAPTSARPSTPSPHGGSGVVVLPCGAGKTLVGAAAMARAGATTLILVTNTVARPAVEGRAAQAHLPDRGGDRRVQRRGQGDPARHHRHVPGPHARAGRAPTRTSSCSTRGTGA